MTKEIHFVKVVPFVENEKEEDGKKFKITEIPIDNDTRQVLLSTLTSQYPNASGLRYKSSAGHWRAVQLVDGRFLSPEEDGWTYDRVYYVTVNELTQSSSRKRKNMLITDKSNNEKYSKNEEGHDLIVLGVPYETTDEELRSYFKEFGELDFSQIKRDRDGNSRGFAFIRFKSYDVQEKALAQKHQIGKRICELRIPDSHCDSQRSKAGTCKLFIGRLASNCTEADLRSYFSEFGTIVDVYIPRPFREFGFVTFSHMKAVNAVLSKKEHLICGVKVNVNEADPRSKNPGNERFWPMKDMFWPGYSYDFPYEDFRLSSNDQRYRTYQSMFENYPITPQGFYLPSGGDTGSFHRYPSMGKFKMPYQSMDRTSSRSSNSSTMANKGSFTSSSGSSGGGGGVSGGDNRRNDSYMSAMFSSSNTGNVNNRNEIMNDLGEESNSENSRMGQVNPFRR
ncbi:hypothetical protein SNEBB_007826 [Seison nebaliae]|nr:hypothetical protein SNEBB_007826 [Seison nebaliae]